MTADLQEAGSDLSRDLSPEWLDLSSRVRRLALEAQSKSADSSLAAEALRLCDHVERLHADVEQLLVTLRTDHSEFPEPTPVAAHSPPPPEKINEANLQIQREMHQKSDLEHIIKALFMWKDDPEKRAREHFD